MDSPMLWFGLLILLGLALLVLSLAASGRHYIPNQTGVIMRYDKQPSITLPAQWQEDDIRMSVEEFVRQHHDEQNLLSYYVNTLKTRFIDSQNIKVKDQRTKYLESVIRNLSATRDAATLLYELRRLDAEQQIKDRRVATEYANAAEIADLEQELIKEQLRTKIAKNQQKREQFSNKKSNDDKQMDEARQRRRLDFQWHAETAVGTKVEKLAALQQWKKRKQQEIIADKSLSDREKDELFDMLDESYEEAKRQLNQDTNPFEDD